MTTATIDQGADRRRSEARTEFLTDMLTTAVEGGIQYWAQVVSYRWDCPAAARHVTIIEHENTDQDDPPKITVTLDMIASALGRFMRDEDGCRFVESAGDGQVKLANRTNGDDGDVDAGDADCILQIAALGEVIYG
jgi:hypothetical protein